MAWAWPWAKADQKDFPQLALFRKAIAFHAVHCEDQLETAMKLTLPQGVIAIAAVTVYLSSPLNAAPFRDGAHDFDFARGTWHTHIIRVLDPFAGGTHTVTMEGTKTARPVWNGRAWLEEIEADGPDGHWEGATFFLYNPKSGQWSQQYIDSASGDFEPPTIGSFKDGRAEFFATTEHEGQVVLVRGVWSDITAASHRYEISYSRDGGRTWMTAFKAYLTRIKD